MSATRRRTKGKETALEAVILAGGKGTRLRPLTDTRPKPLVPFVGAPFAEGLMRRLSRAGARRVTFLVGLERKPFLPLERLGAGLGLDVAVVGEPEPLDTAGACRNLLRDAREDVLVCNGDILTDLDYAGLVRAHRDRSATVTLALTRVEDTSSFGVVETAANGAVVRFVEKPAPGTATADTVNAGTYVVAPGALSAFGGAGPLSFEREVFPGLLRAGESLLGVVDDGYWLDLGTPQRYLQGTRAVLDGRCDWPILPPLHRDGTVVAHASARLADQVGPYLVAGPRAHVGDGAHVSGSVLFEDVVVGRGARVDDCVLAEGTVVAEGAVVRGAVTAAGERVA